MGLFRQAIERDGLVSEQPPNIIGDDAQQTAQLREAPYVRPFRLSGHSRPKWKVHASPIRADRLMHSIMSGTCALESGQFAR